MVQRVEAVHEIERIVDERQRLRVAFLQEHVGDAGFRQPARAEIEQARGQVDTDDLADLRRDDLRRVGGAARHVEHEHVGIQWFQLLDRAARSSHERRVGPGEQADLAVERAADEVVVVAHPATLAALAGACTDASRALHRREQGPRSDAQRTNFTVP